MAVSNKTYDDLLGRLELVDDRCAELDKDKQRLDWLADKNNHIGNVQLPNICVEENLTSLRGAIDQAMKIDAEHKALKKEKQSWPL